MGCLRPRAADHGSLRQDPVDERSALFVEQSDVQHRGRLHRPPPRRGERRQGVRAAAQPSTGWSRRRSRRRPSAASSPSSKEIFVDTDAYFFAGPAFVNLTEREDCGAGTTVNCSERENAALGDRAWRRRRGRPRVSRLPPPSASGSRSTPASGRASGPSGAVSLLEHGRLRREGRRRERPLPGQQGRQLGPSSTSTRC